MAEGKWEKNGYRVGKIENPIACYGPLYIFERAADSIRFITLKPGEKHEVPIKEAYLLLTYFDRLRNGQNYELEVRFKDECTEPGVRRVYVGKAKFSTWSRSPKGVYSR